MSQHPRITPGLDARSALAEARPAYRFEGRPGTGKASHISYDETAASGARFNSLGHEAVHAWRGAHGLQVARLFASPHADAPVIRNNPPIVRDVVGHHLHMQEEFETVGLRPTPHAPQGWAPNENMIRAEHGLPARTDYSGQTPANTNETLRDIDRGTDTRSWAAKHLGKVPSPVGHIIDSLEK